MHSVTLVQYVESIMHEALILQEPKPSNRNFNQTFMLTAENKC